MANPHRETHFHYDKVVIGQSVYALSFAYAHSIPIFGVSKHKPLRFRYIDKDIDLSTLNVKNEENVFQEFNREVVYGMEEIKLWNILVGQLALSGLSPVFGNYQEFNFDKNYLQLISENSKKVKVFSDKFLIFDALKYSAQFYDVNDYIHIHSNQDFKITRFLGRDSASFFSPSLCYDTLFFPSERMPGKGYDCCTMSRLSKEILSDFKYSATAARMEVEREVFWNISKDIRVSLSKREVAPIYSPLTDDLDGILNYDLGDSFFDKWTSPA